MTILFALFACGTGDDDDGDGSASGDERGEPSEAVDLLFVVDNSDSMQDNVGAFALAADVLFDAIPDLRAAITTVTVDYTADGNTSVDPGEAGLLAGDPTASVDEFRTTLLCEVANFKEDLVISDAAYDDSAGCPTPEAEVSQEYLDCVCGVGGWGEHTGSGNEEGLEAVLLTACRSAEEPPETCYDEDSPFAEADEGTVSFWEGDARPFVLLLTDEGDNSRRGQSADASPAPYVEDLRDVGLEPAVAILAPPYPLDEDGVRYGDCLDGAQPWAVERYQAFAKAFSGVYVPLTETDYPDCSARDFSDLVEDAIGAL